nr:hypothetical protein CFP56_19525 [Quercus suber]
MGEVLAQVTRPEFFSREEMNVRGMVEDKLWNVSPPPLVIRPCVGIFTAGVPELGQVVFERRQIDHSARPGPQVAIKMRGATEPQPSAGLAVEPGLAGRDPPHVVPDLLLARIVYILAEPTDDDVAQRHGNEAAEASPSWPWDLHRRVERSLRRREPLQARLLDRRSLQHEWQENRGGGRRSCAPTRNCLAIDEVIRYPALGRSSGKECGESEPRTTSGGFGEEEAEMRALAVLHVRDEKVSLAASTAALVKWEEKRPASEGYWMRDDSDTSKARWTVDAGALTSKCTVWYGGMGGIPASGKPTAALPPSQLQMGPWQPMMQAGG